MYIQFIYCMHCCFEFCHLECLLLMYQVIHNVGLCIALWDIVKMEDSYIFPMDGSSHTVGESLMQFAWNKAERCSVDGIYLIRDLVPSLPTCRIHQLTLFSQLTKFCRTLLLNSGRHRCCVFEKFGLRVPSVTMGRVYSQPWSSPEKQVIKCNPSHAGQRKMGKLTRKL